jgi:beta-N-acetylhexosaminidase
MSLGRSCLIFIDQEGGRVARLKAPEWPVFPPLALLGRLYGQDQQAGREAVYLSHRLIAHELAALGIFADCAPVLDLPQPGAHDIIGDRALGLDPATIAVLGELALKGLRDGGVAGVIKHIPGHGRAAADSHEALPQVDASLEQLEQDFAPFRALNSAPMAMTAHVAYEAIDHGVAATLSPKVIGGVIRNKIGFDGLLMGDDLGMQALTGTLTERAERAFAAGCDVMLHCSGFLSDAEAILSEMEEVANACPVLSGKAELRADRAMAWAGLAQPFDVVEGRRALDAHWQRAQSLVAAALEQVGS